MPLPTAEELQEKFNTYNENDKISRASFKIILQELGNSPTDEFIDTVFDNIDGNKDRLLDREEYENWIQKMLQPEEEEKAAIVKAFQIILKSVHKDRMPIKEFTSFLQNKGQEKLSDEDASIMETELIKLDRNGDETIDGEELVLYLMDIENIEGNEQTEQNEEHTEEQNQEETLEENQEQTDGQPEEQTEEMTEEQTEQPEGQTEQTEGQTEQSEETEGQTEGQTEETGQTEQSEETEGQTEGQTEEQGQTEGQTEEPTEEQSQNQENQDGEQNETQQNEQTEDNTEQTDNADTQETQKTDEA